jgi:hypothetical protein
MLQDYMIAPPEMPSIPHSKEAEEAVIGSVIINPEVYLEIAEFLSSEDFYVHRFRWIWKAFKSMFERDVPIDLLTLSEELEKDGVLEEIGGPASLTNLVNQVPSSLNAVAYARVVEADAIRRKMIAQAEEIAKIARDPGETIEDALLVHQDIISKNIQLSTSQKPKSAIVAGENLKEKINSGKSLAFSTGIAKFNSSFGGFPIGSKTVLIADTSVGKTALALQLAEEQSKQGHKTLYVSLESGASSEHLIARRVLGKLGISPMDWRNGVLTGSQKEQINDEIDHYMRLHGENLMFEERVFSIEDLERKIASIHPQFMILDHLRKLPGGTETKDILNNFYRLDAACRKVGVTSLIIHTITVDGGNQDYFLDPPSWDILGWAKDLRYEPDLVLAMFGKPTNQQHTEDAIKAKRVVWLMKDRDGERFSQVYLTFDKQKQWFE